MGKRSKPTRPQKAQRWDDVPETNSSFEAYYKAQGIVLPEEWPNFMRSLKAELPTTFRITGSRKTADEVNDLIRTTFVPFLSAIEVGADKVVAPPRPIPWYPDGLAWQYSVNKQAIRKVEGFKRFQNFLVYESEAGNISRQEAVSMIPPLLLDVKPHHRVLDMCAAPGSKTAQLLEALHADAGDVSAAGPSIPSGLLVANDSDYKRTHLLVHQSLRRIPSPAMMVTNLDASAFPALKVPRSTMDQSDERPGASRLADLPFDRVLCDVPCSGDGTLRKNVNIWRDWNVGNAHGLHLLQLKILRRGIRLLRPGGVLVYSTCSLNPIENEAVVSAALALCPEVTIADVSDRLAGLERRPGMTSWKVMRKDASAEIEAATDVADDDRKKRFATTMWPDGKEASRHLERCMRIYPHLQDSGGFFVAVLRKNGPSDAQPAQDPRLDLHRPAMTAATAASNHDANLKRAASPASADVSDGKRQKAQPNTADEEGHAAPPQPVLAEASAVPDDCRPSNAAQLKPFKEEPYTYLSPDDEQVETCCAFFGLDERFPRSNLLVRNASGQPLRSIYLTTTLVRQILDHNAWQRIRLISCGVKLFARQDNRTHADESLLCKWRVVSDGTTFFRAFIGPPRLFQCSLATLKHLMNVGELYPRFESLEEDAFREAMQSARPGSCIIDVQPGECDGALLSRVLPVGVWISRTSVNLMLEKRDKAALALRLWGKEHA